MRRRALLLLGWLAACSPPSQAEEPPAVPDDDTAALFAPHREGNRFSNPWAPHDVHSIGDFFRWRLSANPWDKRRPPVVPIVANDGAGLAGVEHSASVTWVGHATVAVHDGAEVFLTDPHFGPRALLPRRVTPPGIPIESVPADAFAVLSHNHYDHLDAWSVEHLPESMHWFVSARASRRSSRTASAR